MKKERPREREAERANKMREKRKMHVHRGRTSDTRTQGIFLQFLHVVAVDLHCSYPQQIIIRSGVSLLMSWDQTSQNSKPTLMLNLSLAKTRLHRVQQISVRPPLPTLLEFQQGRRRFELCLCYSRMTSKALSTPEKTSFCGGILILMVGGHNICT